MLMLPFCVMLSHTIWTIYKIGEEEGGIVVTKIKLGREFWYTLILAILGSAIYII